jgi:hypothetical protein
MLSYMAPVLLSLESPIFSDSPRIIPEMLDITQNAAMHESFQQCLLFEVCFVLATSHAVGVPLDVQ